MKGLKILLIPIIVIILLVVGLLFGLRIYGDHHPNNKSIKSFNMRNPLEPTKEYYVKKMQIKLMYTKQQVMIKKVTVKKSNM